MWFADLSSVCGRRLMKWSKLQRINRVGFISSFMVNICDVLNLLLEKDRDSTHHLLQASHQVLLKKLMWLCDIFFGTNRKKNIPVKDLSCKQSALRTFSSKVDILIFNLVLECCIITHKVWNDAARANELIAMDSWADGPSPLSLE